MSKGNFDAAIDVIGGKILSSIIANMKYNGLVTVCGNVANPNFSTTVFPFILRSNRLIGIDSASHPIEIREDLEQVASSWKIKNLNHIAKIIDLSGLGNEIRKILCGKQIGRIIVKL